MSANLFDDAKLAYRSHQYAKAIVALEKAVEERADSYGRAVKDLRDALKGREPPSTDEKLEKLRCASGRLERLENLDKLIRPERVARILQHADLRRQTEILTRLLVAGEIEAIRMLRPYDDSQNEDQKPEGYRAAEKEDSVETAAKNLINNFKWAGSRRFVAKVIRWLYLDERHRVLKKLHHGYPELFSMYDKVKDDRAEVFPAEGFREDGLQEGLSAPEILRLAEAVRARAALRGEEGLSAAEIVPLEEAVLAAARAALRAKEGLSAAEIVCLEVPQIVSCMARDASTEVVKSSAKTDTLRAGELLRAVRGLRLTPHAAHERHDRAIRRIVTEVVPKLRQGGHGVQVSTLWYAFAENPDLAVFLGAIDECDGFASWVSQRPPADNALAALLAIHEVRSAIQGILVADLPDERAPVEQALGRCPQLREWGREEGLSTGSGEKAELDVERLQRRLCEELTALKLHIHGQALRREGIEWRREEIAPEIEARALKDLIEKLTLAKIPPLVRLEERGALLNIVVVDPGHDRYFLKPVLAESVEGVLTDEDARKEFDQMTGKKFVTAALSPTLVEEALKEKKDFEGKVLTRVPEKIGTILDEIEKRKGKIATVPVDFTQEREREESGEQVKVHTVVRRGYEGGDIAVLVPTNPSEKLSDMANRTGAKVLINANFFGVQPEEWHSGMAFKDPIGLLVIDGKVIVPPLFSRSALLITDNDTAIIARVSMRNMTIKLQGCESTFYAISEKGDRQVASSPESARVHFDLAPYGGRNDYGDEWQLPRDKVVVFTRAFGESTKDAKSRYELGVSYGQVILKRFGGGNPIPMNGFVLSFPLDAGDGQEWTRLQKNVVTGSKVTIAFSDTFTHGEAFKSRDCEGHEVMQAIAGLGILRPGEKDEVKTIPENFFEMTDDGHPKNRRELAAEGWWEEFFPGAPPTSFPYEIKDRTSARTAVGIRPDGKLVFVVADGLTDLYGYSIDGLAKLVKGPRCKCKWGLMLDGGGSSEIVVCGTIANLPSDLDEKGDWRERRLATGFGVFAREEDVP